jgi:DNA-binding XRE family transcriptional regulator
MTALAAVPEHVTVTPDDRFGELSPGEEGAAQAGWRSAVGNRVRVLRGERGLSQRALAQAAGVGLQTVRRVEAGRGGAPLLTTLWGIADGLGVYMADLVAEPGTSRLDRPVPLVRQQSTET